MAMKRYILLIIFLVFGVIGYGQTDPDAQPEILTPVNSDKVYTQTRGALKSLRLDTLKNQFMVFDYNSTSLSYNPDTITTVPDSLRGAFWVGANGNTYYIDGNKNVLKFTSEGAGSGDMLKSTYDPTLVAGDVFNMDNMVEGTTTKILTSTERTKLSGIETGATADQVAGEVNITDSGGNYTGPDVETALSEIADSISQHRTDIDAGGGGGSGDVTAAANLGDNLLVRGDGAVKGVQNSGISISDGDAMSGAGIDGSANTITNIGLGELDTDFTDIVGLALQVYLDSPTVGISESGGTVSLEFEKSGGGDVRVYFSDGVYTYDCTPTATVALTEGSDISPQINYIYILQSTKTITASTTGWPSGEYAPIATVIIQSAASVASDGPYKVHAWTDHSKNSDDIGHISHLNYWIRMQQATWASGVSLTPTDGAGTLDIATSSGSVLQLHNHTFPAFNTGTGSEVYIINHPDVAYQVAQDLTQTYLDKDINGTVLGAAATDFYNVVVWGAVNEDLSDCKMFANAPDGAYNSNNSDKATNDDDNTAVYDIPAEYTGVGFLIARLTIQESGGTYTVLQNEDLRGKFPSTQAGGGGGSGGSIFIDNVHRIQDDGDITKQLAFEVSGVTIGTTRTLTVPDSDGTIALIGHGGDHITSGSDEIDGDKLDIDYAPSNYTPSTTPSEADNVDNLTAHLYGIDNALSGGSSPILSAYKTSDETKTEDVVFTIDDDLQLELEAGGVYEIFVSLMTNSHADSDMKIKFDYGGTYSVGGYFYDHDNLTAFFLSLGTSTNINGYGNDRVARLVIKIHATTAGTFGLMWSQGTSSVESTTLKEGSSFISIKLN